VNHADKINESLDDLHRLRAQQKLTLRRDRIGFLIGLKNGYTQAQAGAQIGIKLRQSQKLWRLYRSGGLAALLVENRKTYLGKLSCAQISRLRSFLQTDQADTLRSVQGWLASNEQVEYSLGGISLLFKRLKIKLKTGRPSNVRQDREGREAFKKTSHS
jgi:transposase